MTRDYFVYGWYRDRACTEIFYVGKGTRRRHQWWNWISYACKNPRLVRAVRDTVEKLGYVPTKRLWNHLTEAQAWGIEKRTIAEIGRYPNGPLVNLTDGGTGGAITPEAQVRRTIKLRGRPAHNKGKPMSSEQRALVEHTFFKPGHQTWNKGVPTPDETLAKHRGRKRSAETRAKMSAAKKGKPSPNKGKPMLSHVKEVLLQANLGKQDPPKTRQKKSISARTSWAQDADRRAALSARMRAHWATMRLQPKV